jgi:putative flippase GtrA
MKIKINDWMVQFVLYSFVGVVSLCFDLGCFVLFSNGCNIPPIYATSFSFIVATSVNYWLCYKVIFLSRPGRGIYQILRLFLVASVGLMCNTACFSIFLSMTKLSPLSIKILVIPIVMAWNFCGRKFFVFTAQIPANTKAYVAKILAKVDL